MANKPVAFVEAKRLHGVFDLRHNFDPKVNIIYGQNGVGKTTLLHILANALAGDYARFVFLQFEAITVGLADRTVVKINRTLGKHGLVEVDASVNDCRVARYRAMFRTGEDRPSRTRFVPSRVAREVEQHHSSPVSGVSYFPAFRSMLDAWVAAARDGAIRTSAPERTPTDFARRLFGQFVPELTYPSLIDIESRLHGEVGHAFRLVSEAETTQMGLAAEAVFQEIVSASHSEQRPTNELVREIKALCQRIRKVSEVLGRKEGTDLSRLAGLVGDPERLTTLPPHARSILEVYEKTLQSVAMAQEQAIRQLDIYLTTINSFFCLGEKRLIIAPDGVVRIRHDRGGRELPLQTLSSGERQIVAMVYEATHMSDKEVVLIDEPELSLHVDWQRPLVGRMAEQMGDKQIIVTTHSPVIGADLDVLQELNLDYTRIPLPYEELLAGGAEVHVRQVQATSEDVQHTSGEKS